MGIGLPVELITTPGVNGAGGGAKLIDLPPNGAEPKLGAGVVGAGDTVVCRVAACNAIFCASLSPPANMMPDNVPVKNVAIGITNSKNFWSIGEMALSGCVTKINE